MNLRTSKALAAALLLVAAAGCTDTTVEPKSTVSEANVFNDPGAYRAFIARVYAGLAVTGQQGPNGQPDIADFDEGFSNYVRVLWCAQELPTDEVVIGWGDPGLPPLNTQTWTASNEFVTATYYRIFFQISMANEFLRQTTDDRLSGRGNVGPALYAEIQTYRAEARFLRALSYWHGIDLFGDIPLVTEADALGSTPPQQAARADIYTFVVSELTAILPDLPAPGVAANYGRATSMAAQMVLAKLYMNAAVYTGTPNYTAAMTAVQAVIAGPFTLDNNYRDPFLADNNTSPEIIFAVTQDGLRTRTWGGTTFLIHAACGGPNMPPDPYGINGCWWGYRVRPEAYNRYQPGDTRTSTVYTNGQSLTIGSVGDWSQGYWLPKFSNRTSAGAAGSDLTHPDTDFPMFRLTDAYLMYAELNLRGGGGSAATALGYVNLIRQRAYGGPAGDITAGQLDLAFVLDERSRELYAESHRRTDLVRYGLFTGGTYLWSWKGGTQAGVATAVTRNLYPIPANELIANPNLTQNPGY